jgi:hypothetical protein
MLSFLHLEKIKNGVLYRFLIFISRNNYLKQVTLFQRPFKRHTGENRYPDWWGSHFLPSYRGEACSGPEPGADIQTNPLLPGRAEKNSNHA